MNNHKFWDAFTIVTTLLGVSIISFMITATLIARASQELQGL